MIPCERKFGFIVIDHSSIKRTLWRYGIHLRKSRADILGETSIRYFNQYFFMCKNVISVNNIGLSKSVGHSKNSTHVKYDSSSINTIKSY